MKTTVSLEDLTLMGVDEETALCWFQIRKDKKSRTLTTITLKKIMNQGNILGWDLNRVITKCVEKEWKGFEASWVNKAELGFIERQSDTSWSDSILQDKRGLQ